MPGIHIGVPRKRCKNVLHLSLESQLDGLSPGSLLPQIIPDTYKPLEEEPSREEGSPPSGSSSTPIPTAPLCPAHRPACRAGHWDAASPGSPGSRTGEGVAGGPGEGVDGGRGLTSSFIQYHLFQRVVYPQEKREELCRPEYPATDLPTFPPQRA